jgi:hypothetical protein
MEKLYAKHFQNKLKSYSAVAGTIIAAANTADAQVVYTDIIPDSTVITDAGYYDLDLNNDGTFDFNFKLTLYPGGTTSYAVSYNKVGVTPLGSNAINGSATGAYIYPLAMNVGETVQSSLQFNVGGSQSMASFWAGVAGYGNWQGVTDKYIGLKLDVAGTIYYGWARLDIEQFATQFTIKDYAYMNAADQPIVIGSGTTGIQQTTLAGVTIYNDNRTVFIQTENEVNGTIRVVNAIGEEVFSKPSDGTASQISLSNVTSGIYFVSITAQNIRYTKKILIN